MIATSTIEIGDIKQTISVLLLIKIEEYNSAYEYSYNVGLLVRYKRGKLKYFFITDKHERRRHHRLE